MLYYKKYHYFHFRSGFSYWLLLAEGEERRKYLVYYKKLYIVRSVRTRYQVRVPGTWLVHHVSAYFLNALLLLGIVLLEKRKGTVTTSKYSSTYLYFLYEVL